MDVGLGEATGVERLEILWPGVGQPQVLSDLAVNQVIEIVQEVPDLSPLGDGG